MSAPDRFETKRGECRIEDGRLVLDESVLGYLRNLYAGYWEADEWWRKAMFLGTVLAIPIGAASIGLSVAGGSFDPVATAIGGGAVLAILGVVTVYQRVVRGFTNRSTIPLDAIERVSFTRGSKGATRPRFVVTFEVHEERRQRYVLMPSLYVPDAEHAIETAKATFRAQGFDIEGADGEASSEQRRHSQP
jgi:hypothetical protein